MELTQQQKLEILCAYLPHGVEVENTYGNKIKLKASHFFNDYGDFIGIDKQAKLILRHPDDMTEEENDKYVELWADSNSNSIESWLACLHYLWSLHIDTFGAIEAGWAVRKNK